MRLLSSGILVLLLGAAAASAGSPQETVNAMLDRYLSAWAKANADEIASNYVSDGEFVPPGGKVLHGRQAVAAFYQAAFLRGYTGSHAAASFDEVKPIGRDVILATGPWSIDGAKLDNQLYPRECGQFVLVLQKKPHPANEWQVVYLQEVESKCGT